MKRREIIGVSRTGNGLRPYIGERGGSLAEIATIAPPNSKAATISTAHSPTIMEIAVLCGGKKGISGGAKKATCLNTATRMTQPNQSQTFVLCSTRDGQSGRNRYGETTARNASPTEANTSRDPTENPTH